MFQSANERQPQPSTTEFSADRNMVMFRLAKERGLQRLTASFDRQSEHGDVPNDQETRF